jgi:hypothetical protein
MFAAADWEAGVLGDILSGPGFVVVDRTRASITALTYLSCLEAYVTFVLSPCHLRADARWCVWRFCSSSAVNLGCVLCHVTLHYVIGDAATLISS